MNLSRKWQGDNALIQIPVPTQTHRRADADETMWSYRNLLRGSEARV
ncbi:MAG TPA: hypothetical protein VK638_20545 [Edaphobacter sp.]|nr:hypothetical protein [Edaphobacter sp.]